MLSGPALPSFNFKIADLISLIDGAAVLIRNVLAGSLSVSNSLSSSSKKHSLHLFICCSSVVKCWPAIGLGYMQIFCSLVALQWGVAFLCCASESRIQLVWRGCLSTFFCLCVHCVLLVFFRQLFLLFCFCVVKLAFESPSVSIRFHVSSEIHFLCLYCLRSKCFSAVNRMVLFTWTQDLLTLFLGFMVKVANFVHNCWWRAS